MQKAFAPATSDVAGLIREATAAGHVVILPAPVRPARAAPASGEPGVPRAVAFHMLFNLTPAEGRVLAALMDNAHVAREALHRAMSADGNPVSKI